MEKFGCEFNPETPDLEKVAGKGATCPRCGTAIEIRNPPWCPSCGTEPFEKRQNQDRPLR